VNKARLRDPRFWLLSAALLCFLAALVVPSVQASRDSFDILFVVDITGSMNTRDYTQGGQPVSRLETVKAALRQTLVDLPCQSHVSLGLFAERGVFLLFNPIEVCSNFAPISGSVAAFNWREGWEGDSHIAEGLYRAVAIAANLHTDLVFMTDGQEAPPLPWNGGPSFDGKPGAVKGLVVGVGGYALSPIPKYDDNGREVGFYGPDDVLQESRFGLPPPGAEKRPGYNPRNAPFGNVQVNNNEHLSSVKEPYLKGLAEKTGLTYAHLVDEPEFFAALSAHATPHPVSVMVERGSIAAALGLICLFCVYALLPLLRLLKAPRWLHSAKSVLQRAKLVLGRRGGAGRQARIVNIAED
jgi:mxaL protein